MFNVLQREGSEPGAPNICKVELVKRGEQGPAENIFALLVSISKLTSMAAPFRLMCGVCEVSERERERRIGCRMYVKRAIVTDGGVHFKQLHEQ